MTPGKKKKSAWELVPPALHWDVTCERWECILGLTWEGGRVLVLLSCSLGTLDRVICSWQRLLLPTQHISSHASLYQHLGAANPTCSHRTKWILLEEV